MGSVFVVREDGSLLVKVAFYVGATAEEINDMLRSDGLEGNLHSSAGRILPKALLSPGATYTFIEEQPKDDAWFRKHEKLPSPSALAKSVSAMVSAFGSDEPVYDLGRTSGSAVPLPLANESFRRYIRNLQSCVRDAVDWSFVYNSMNMSRFFSDDRQRQLAFADYLEQFLTDKMPSVIFNVTSSPAGGSEPDILVEALIMEEWLLILLVEVKPEVGLQGEPSVEVMRHYANHFITRRSVYHWVYLLSCCPVLIVEIVGPTIRVGGAAFFDKPTHEPFTPYLHIHRFLQDNGHFQLLSKALASIGVAVSSLVEFYTTLRQQQQRKADPRTRDPTISWPDIIRDEHFKGAAVTQYSRPKVQTNQLWQQPQHQEREKLLIFSLLRPASKRIVKFSQRYGLGVHQNWAGMGYAPPFTYKQLNGNWLLVDMEYFTEADGWRCLTALDPGLSDPNETDSFNMYRLSWSDWEACKTAVKSAYLEVHSAHPEDVHGDLRRPNILYNVRTGKVAFIDFDWAGVDGSELYPLFINPTIAWPPGVGSCQPMRSSHDIAVLNMELALNL